MANTVTKDMTTGNPLLLLLKFSVPMLIGNIFQQLYNLVDSIVVGKYIGPDALAAVGTTATLNFFIFSLIIGLASGVSIVISQYFGAKDEENVRKSFATSTYLIMGVAIVTGILGFIFCRQLLMLLDTPDKIMKDAVGYMRISCLGVIGIAGYNGISSTLRALGDSITPLLCLALASVLNIVLDLVFVLVIPLGVPGVGLATIISQTVSFILCTVYAFWRIKMLRMPLKEFKPSKEMSVRCLKMGIPIAIQNAFVSCSSMALQKVINSFGSVIMASATAANRVEQIIIQPGVSIGIAISTFTGQNIGAGKRERVKEGFFAATKIIVIFSLILLPIIFFGAEEIMKLFTNMKDQNAMEVIKNGVMALRIPCFFYSFLGMIFVSRSLLSGAGDVKIAMAMGFVEVICRVLFANILASYFGPIGIWWATGITWLTTGIVGCIRYASGKWKNKSVIG